jgi:hypothetical protein
MERHVNWIVLSTRQNVRKGIKNGNWLCFFFVWLAWPTQNPQARLFAEARTQQLYGPMRVN